MVAFVSFVDGKRQIWIRLLAGGAPLQVTHDAVHHQHPRWSPDSSALLYYTPSDSPGVSGTLWEVSAFGGRPRRIGSSIGGGDTKATTAAASRCFEQSASLSNSPS